MRYEFEIFDDDESEDDEDDDIEEERITIAMELEHIKRSAYAEFCLDCFSIIREGRLWYIGVADEMGRCVSCGRHLDETCTSREELERRRAEYLRDLESRKNFVAAQIQQNAARNGETTHVRIFFFLTV